MRAAKTLFNIINLMHIAFYAYMSVIVLNFAEYHETLRSKLIQTLIIYVTAVVILTIIARVMGKGLKNPIHQHQYASYLHFASVVVFLVGFLGARNYNPDFKYLVIVSIPLAIVAFILSLKNDDSNSGIDKENLIDDFE